MHKYTIPISIYLLLSPVTLYAASCSSIASLEWILGNWSVDNGKNISTELWKEVSQTTFEGHGEVRSKLTKKLQSSESLRLVQMQGEIFYLAKVSHNELPVAFRLKDCSHNKAIFENPDHDFPRLLEYQLETENSLTVKVSDGKEKGFKVNYVRDISRRSDKPET